MNKPAIKVSLFVLFGVIVSALWLILFVAGLLVDSSYYRAAISYGFAGPADWLWAILSFTISNVTILAFLAGLLGGICSKMIITESFTIDTKQLQARKVSYILYENPFVSAFRGLFVFVALLSIQYLSSFNDLGSSNSGSQQTQVVVENNNNGLFDTLRVKIKDSASKVIIEKVQTTFVRVNETNELVKEIVKKKSELKNLQKSPDANNYSAQETLKAEIWSLRKELKLPSNDDFSGISSLSYFKFAIIVSLLAFIFGYDPSLFAGFLSKIPILSGKDKKDPVVPPKEETKEEPVK